MGKTEKAYFSRREREILDIIYRLGEASVSDVKERMTEDPSYDSVRVILGILVKKGHLMRQRKNRRYTYRPAVSRRKASRSAIRNLMRTFFSGAPSQAILAMIDESSERLTEEELDEIAARIEEERQS